MIVYKALRIENGKMKSLNTSEGKIGNSIEYKRGLNKAPAGTKLFVFDSLVNAVKCLDNDWSSSPHVFVVYECYADDVTDAPITIPSPLHKQRGLLWCNGKLVEAHSFSPTPKGTCLTPEITLKKRVLVYTPKGDI